MMVSLTYLFYLSIEFALYSQTLLNAKLFSLTLNQLKLPVTGQYTLECYWLARLDSDANYLNFYLAVPI